jgi:serine/threonine protein kinase
MHEAGFVHADIKPNNIFVDKRLNPIIFDFNISQKIDSIVEPKGTINYISPEFLEGIQKNQLVKYTPEIDTFSLGILFYFMLYQKLPFKHIGTFNALKNTEIKIDSNTKKSFFKIIYETIKAPKENRADLKQLLVYIYHYLSHAKDQGILKNDFVYKILESNPTNSSDLDPLFSGVFIVSINILSFVLFIVYFLRDLN